MLSESADLPKELLDKLEALQLELDEGDITVKGFEKKKEALFEEHAQAKVMQSKEDDLGPEPSAADVVDFLDFLPSPTHSPPRNHREAVVNEGSQLRFRPETQVRPSPPANHPMQPPPYLLEQPVYRSDQPIYRPHPNSNYSPVYHQYPQQPQQPYYNAPSQRPIYYQNRPQPGAYPPQYFNQPQQYVRGPAPDLRARPNNMYMRPRPPNGQYQQYPIMRDPARPM